MTNLRAVPPATLAALVLVSQASLPWQSYLESAKSQLDSVPDDIACTREVERLAKEAPDGAGAFALLVACADVGRFRDLDILTTRPWRQHLDGMRPDAMYRLIARIIAARGTLEDDLEYCQDRGLFLLDFDQVHDDESASAETEYALIGGTVSDRYAEDGRVFVSVEEVRRGTAGGWRAAFAILTQSHLYVFSGRTGKQGARLKTGRFLIGRFDGKTKTEVGEEYAFLARIRTPTVRREVAADEDVREIVWVGAWPIQEPVPDFTRRIRERGLDVKEPEIERFVLPNGLVVILHPDRRLPLVHVNVAYRVGAYHEAPKKSGFAHLFEHLMFQGSAHVARNDHIRRLEALGSVDVNAATTFDRTMYTQTVPKAALETTLWLESDRMGYLLDRLTPEAFTTQQRVVQNERRERLVDAPYGPADAAIVEALYPGGHPYRGGVIGYAEDIDGATIDDARSFYETFYRPSNASLVIAGDIDIEETKALVRRYFAGLPTRDPPTVAEPELPRLRGKKTVRVDVPNARFPRLSMVWVGPVPYSPGTAELDIAAYLLDSNGMNLLRERLEKHEVDVRDVEARFVELAGGSRFEVHVVLGSLPDPRRIVNDVEKVLYEVRRLAPTEQDVAGYARAFETSMSFQMQTLGGRASMFQIFEHLRGDPAQLVWHLERYQRVTPTSLQQQIRQHLDGNKLVVIAVPAPAAEQR